MLIFGNSPRVVVFGPLRVWAENGFVCIEDSRPFQGKTGGFKQLHPRDAGKHLVGVSEMLGKKTDKDFIKYSDAWRLHMKFVEECHVVIQRAFDQGVYDDPKASKDKMARRATSVLIPSSTAELPL